MKSYHTTIWIDAPIEQVWRELVDFDAYPEWNPLVGSVQGRAKQGSKIKVLITPLKRQFHARLIRVKVNQELTWKGGLGADFLLAGKHYYQLESKDGKTLLKHGEYFSGLFSYLIPKFLLKKMRKAFEMHNIALKKRVENGN